MLDAFTSGVAPDGLKSKEEIKIFICYLLNSVPRNLPFDKVAGIILSGNIANYYEITSATKELLESGCIVKDEEGLLFLTESGRIIAKSLYAKLPGTVRKRAMNSAMLLISRLQNEEQNSVQITPCNSGYNVRCNVMNGDMLLLGFDIFAPDSENAKHIADSFLDAPQQAYKMVLAFLIGDEAVFGKPPAIKVNMENLPADLIFEESEAEE